jgi:uncharacterized membrane protein
LVDIAIMALSPPVNDPNSAVEVIQEMGFLFCERAGTPLGHSSDPTPTPGPAW